MISELDMDNWQGFISLYEAIFDEDEREDTVAVKKCYEEGRYKIFMDGDKGFYIVDQAEGYNILTFLGVDESCRGEGIGSTLCIDATKRFNELFIEAKERQARLYATLGFKRIDMPYFTPLYDSDESEASNLMMFTEKTSLSADFLTKVVYDIFSFGYKLEDDDPRMIAQLNEAKKERKVL